ncbi:uncharacterized protein JCM10292_004233 [Rhodotorula paludigena]|uniref:uncharacterized protein n=1 Tax=Rhodotorula paludigena TaxID=86838 RepID=UPI00317F87BC
MTVSGLLPYIRHQKLKGRIKADGPEVLALQTRSSMEQVVELLQQNGYDINNTVHVIDAAAITFGQYQQLRDGVQYAPLNIAKEKVACGIEAAIEAYVRVIQQSFGPDSQVCVIFDHEHLRPRLKEETDKKRMLSSWRKKESQRRWADKHRKDSKDPTAMELDVQGEIAPRATKHQFQQGMPKRALLAGTPWSEVEVPFPLERAKVRRNPQLRQFTQELTRQHGQAFCDMLGVDSVVAQGEADPLVANKIREFRASHPASQLYVHAVDSDAVVMLRATDSEVLIAPKKLVKLEVLFRVAFESSTEWSRLTSLDAQLAFALLVGHDFSKGLLNIGPVKLIESGKLVTLCNADWFSYTEADFHNALKYALEGTDKAGTWQQQIDQSRVPSLEHMRRALRALRGEDVPAHELGSKDIWRDEVRQELHKAAAALVADRLETTAAGQAWSNIELPFPQKTKRKALLPALESDHEDGAAAAPSQVPPRTPRNPARPQPSKSQQRARAVQGASSRAGSARGVKGNGLTFKGFDIADVEAHRSIRDRVVDFGQRFREAEPAAALWREAEAERQAQKEAAANTPAGSKRQAQDTLDEDVEMSDSEDAGSRESSDNDEGDKDNEDDEEDDEDDELAETDKDEDEEDHVASTKSRSKKSIKQMFALTTQQLQPKQAYRKLAQADELNVKTGKVKVKTDNDGSVDPEDAARHLFELALAQVGLEHGHLVAVAYPKIVKAAFAISPFHNIVRQVTPAHGSHDHVELARWLTLVVETVRMQQGSLVIGKTLAASCPTPPDADKRIDDIEFSGLSAADKKNLVPLFMYDIIDQVRLEQQIRVSDLSRTFHHAALKTMATSCLHDVSQQNDRRLQDLVAACLESDLEQLGILQKYAEEHFMFNAEQPLGLDVSSERLDRLNAADGVQTAMRTVLLKALVAQLKAAPVAYDAGRVKQWRDETRRAVKAWQAHKKAPKEVQDDIYLAKDITNILAELTKILRAGYCRSAELEERTKAAADHEDGTKLRRSGRQRSAPATAPGEQRSPATVRREKAEATATIDSVLNGDKDTTIPRRHMSAVVMALCSTLDQLKLSTYRATSLVLSGDNFSFLVSNYDSVRDTWVANANTIITRAQNAVGRLPVSPGWSTQTVDLKIRHQTRYGQMYRNSDARALYVLLEGVHDLKITRFVTVNHSPDKVIPLLAVNPEVDAQITSLCNMLPQTRALAVSQIAEVVHLLFDTSKFPTFVPHGQFTIQRHAVSILGFDLERVSAPTLVELNTDIITAFNTVLGKRSTQTTGWLTQDGLKKWNKRKYYVLQPNHPSNQYHRVALEPLMCGGGKGSLELSASAASRLDSVTRIYNKWSVAQEAKAKPINFNNVHAKVRSALFGAPNDAVGDIQDPALFDSKTIVVGIDIGETLAAAFTALPPLDHADSPVRVAEVRSSTIYAYDHGDRNTQAEVAAHSNLKCLRDTLGKDESTQADAAFFALLELRNPVRRAIVWQHNQQRQSAFKKLGTDLVRDLCSRFVNSTDMSRKVVVFLGDEGGGNLKDKKPRRKRGTKYGSVIFKHFVEAFKTVPRLKLTICLVNESHSSKRCPDPSCRMERVCKGQQCCLKHPKRKSDNSSLIRLLQCKACTVAFHRDFVGAFNIIWIGLVGAVVYKLHAFSNATMSTFADATQQRSAKAKTTAKRVKR